MKESCKNNTLLEVRPFSMPADVDVRDFSQKKITEPRRNELVRLANSLSNENLPGSHVIKIDRFDVTTSNSRLIVSDSAPVEKGNYIQRASNHIETIKPVLGIDKEQPIEFVADPEIPSTSSNSKIVHFRQELLGIPVFEAGVTVRFRPDGAIKEVVNGAETISQKQSLDKELSVEDAVQKAIRYLITPDPEGLKHDQFKKPIPEIKIDPKNLSQKVVRSTNDPNKFEFVNGTDNIGNIVSSLTWFVIGSEDVRLAWQVIITLSNRNLRYLILVDSRASEILFSRQLIPHMKGQGMVYTKDGSGDRKMVPFPMLLDDYENQISSLPPNFPDDWLENEKTIGNSTYSHAHYGHWQGPEFLDDNEGSAIEGSLRDGLCTFEPKDAQGVEQKTVNAFYLCSLIHDFFYLIGFREVDRNFQQNNYGRGGTPGDRVDVRVFDDIEVYGTASMSTDIEGSNPIMRLGMYSSPNVVPSRHTAFDATVLFHEYTHGVTNRLVGKTSTLGLLSDQSRGMGEGWSDYFACTACKVNVVASWLVNSSIGIRHAAYDSNYPYNFGQIGQIVEVEQQGRRIRIDFRRVHAIGEIWCAALMEMNRNIGELLGLQLVLDALKMSEYNPGLIDGRNDILSALEDKFFAAQLSEEEYNRAKIGIWKAFAKFGMGPHARSNGAQLTGIIPDFSLPSL